LSVTDLRSHLAPAKADPFRLARPKPTRDIAPLPSFGSAADLASLLRLADAGSLQRLVEGLQQTGGNAAVQRMLGGGASPRPTVAQRIRRSSGTGHPLDGESRRKLEPGLGTDLSDVRVHNDAEADELAGDLGARAFTTGTDIFFARGEYDPGSHDGLKTLAHEARHVVQQSRGPVPGTPVAHDLSVSDPDDHAEHDAHETAERIVDGGSVRDAGPTTRTGSGKETGVQRDCGCGGACGSGCGKGPEDEKEKPLQRLAQPGAGPVQVQRAPLTPEKVGGLQVTWDPKATLFLDGGPAAGTPKDIPAGGIARFDNVPRNASGNLQVRADVRWKPDPGQGPGTGPCDFCNLLKTDGIVTVKLSDIFPGVGDLVDFFARLLGQPPPTIALARIIPDIKADLCVVEGIKTAKDFLNHLKQLKVEANDPCAFLSDKEGLDPTFARFLDIACLGAKAGNVIGAGDAIKQALSAAIKNALANVEKAVLKKMPKECLDPNRVVTNQLKGEGTAAATLRAEFFAAGGGFKFQGPPPLTGSNGVGAELVLPVDHSRDSSPEGGRAFLQPVLKSSGTHTNTDPTTPETNTSSKAFEAILGAQALPPERPYKCADAFGPFVINSDRFQDEETQRTRIHQFYFGMAPQVRQDLENGKGLLRVTGRASTTGNKAHNLKLAEKRAKKVETNLRDFAAQDAHLRTFALGEFGAQTPDRKEDANERRCDVNADGTVPGELARGITGDVCSGHEGETTTGGATGPVCDPLVDPNCNLPKPA